MIRRISKRNDYRDIVRSCPSGVIDDIYAVEYYIQGHNEVIQADFTKKGRLLEVILPSSDLENLPNGILMRRSKYKNADASFPDQYYDLEFEDNLNVWLGDVESEEPVIPEYVTEEELSSTLSSYATQEWVSSQQFLTSETLPSDIATQSWVRSYTYDSSTIDYACGKAEDNAITWVQEQGYLTASTIPSDIATQSWVQSQDYITSTDLSGYATESWVQGQGYLTEHQDLSSYATQSWVSSQQFATQSWVSSQGYITIGEIPSGLATQSWVQGQGYITSSALSGYATESWVQNQGYAIEDLTNPFVREDVILNCVQFATGPGLVDAIPTIEDYGDDVALNSLQTRSDRIKAVIVHKDSVTGTVDAGVARYVLEDDGWRQTWFVPFITTTALYDELSGYATESWVQQQGYITSSALSGYATESWVSSQGYITSSALSGYATESWVSSQGYLTRVPSGYATQSWVSSQQFATQSWVSSQDYLEESKVWCGTRSQWENMTSEEQATYKIALVTA